jgi:septum formation inhibitor-activating ATPase MinD
VFDSFKVDCEDKDLSVLMDIINDKYYEQFYLLPLSQVHSREIINALQINLDAESLYAIKYKLFIFTICGSPSPHALVLVAGRQFMLHAYGDLYATLFLFRR